jgi:hypothetical protein
MAHGGSILALTQGARRGRGEGTPGARQGHAEGTPGAHNRHAAGHIREVFIADPWQTPDNDNPLITYS